MIVELGNSHLLCNNLKSTDFYFSKICSSSKTCRGRERGNWERACSCKNYLLLCYLRHNSFDMFYTSEELFQNSFLSTFCRLTKDQQRRFYWSSSTTLRADLLEGYSSICQFSVWTKIAFDMEKLTLSDIYMAKMRIKKFFQTTPCEVSCLLLCFHCQIRVH